MNYLTQSTQRTVEKRRNREALNEPVDLFFETDARDAPRRVPSGCPQENPGAWREELGNAFGATLRSPLLRVLCVR